MSEEIVDLPNKNKGSYKIQKREYELQLKKDEIIRDKIDIKRRECLADAEQHQLEMDKITERIGMKVKQIAWLESKMHG